MEGKREHSQAAGTPSPAPASCTPLHCMAHGAGKATPKAALPQWGPSARMG